MLQWVSCSVERRRVGRNCFCVWRFWRTEICSAYQRGRVGIGCVQGVRGLQWFFLPVSWLWRCKGLGWWAGWHRWSFLQTWLSVGVYSYPVWWPIQTRQLLKCTEQTRWLQCRTWSAAPEAELAQEVHPLLGLFDDSVDVGFPLQVLGDCGSQKPEGFHSRQCCWDVA